MDIPPKALWNFPALVKEQAQRLGDLPFCSFEDGQSFTFAQLDAETDRLASGLAGLGIGPGDRVVAMLGNQKAFLITMIATHKRGAIFVPLNTELKGAFLRHQLSNTEPRVVFVDAHLRPLFDTVDYTGMKITATVTVGGEAAPLPNTRRVAYEELAATPASPAAIVPTDYRAVCMIIFTSGTTGPAKGVVMPHAHCFYYALSARHATGLTQADRMYISMPLFHGTALMLQFYSCLLAGIPAYIAKRFSASTWLDEIRNFGATVTYAVGVMPEFVSKQPARADDADNPLRLSWSVPVSDTWAPAFEKRFATRILQGYGMTEFSVPVWGDLADPVTPGCAGRVIEEFFELQVVDPESDEPLPAGKVGEIVVRPKQPFMFMTGYYRMPEKTIEAWRNLWFHSGDAGYLDDQGRLFYVDRIKDRIRRRGENISAFEIEEVISAHPQVQQCAVVGVKSADAGGEDEVMAFVVTADGGELRAEALMDWCVPRMPRYAVPRFIEFVADIERTASGKVRKAALRDTGPGPKTWDRQSVGYVVPH